MKGLDLLEEMHVELSGGKSHSWCVCPVCPFVPLLVHNTSSQTHARRIVPNIRPCFYK